MHITTIGLDLAKNIFQVCGVTADGDIAFNRPVQVYQAPSQAVQNGYHQVSYSKHDQDASRLMTDEHKMYIKVGYEFQSHQSVRHNRNEYVRGDVYTNTLEGYYSIFKRGMRGVYQHCGEQHLQRYVTEFNFRYNHRNDNDNERRDAALRGISGKRLTYRRTTKAA